ncbi:MAG: hypothetical protein OXC80_04195 [Gammaproteobacteria bacterium]|nr:hypothetical protein [Gammaproteobacteria bacterium]
MNNQDWFEMKDIRDSGFANSPWITLRQEWTKSSGVFGQKGYDCEYVSTVALAVAEQHRHGGDELSVSLLTHNGSGHVGSLSDGEYRASDVYNYYGQFSGIHLVLEQNFTDFQEENALWHLHQDLVLSLGLKHTESEWVRPAENYETVVVCEQGCDKKPQLIKMRSVHLKDYLCARQLGLLIVSKRVRKRVLERRDDISWPEKEFEESGSGYRLCRRISEYDKDEYSETRNSSGASASSSGSEAKLFHVSSELTQNKWIPAAPKSIFVRQDGLGDIGSDMMDADAIVKIDAVLAVGGSWLWFSPALANAIVAETGGVLKWSTRDTGTIGFAGGDIPFGVNKDGKINVHKNDFASLPRQHLRKWVGYIDYPDECESSELLSSQIFRKPAETRAPEADLRDAFKRFKEVSDEKLKEVSDEKLKEVSDKRLKSGILKEENAEMQEIRTNTHRFRAVDEQGLKSLAKDLCRIFAESLDIVLLRICINGSVDENLRSLKLLVKFLAQKIGTEDANSMMGPLFGIQELREGDAHPPSSDYSKEFEKIGIDRSHSLVVQGHDLIAIFVETLNRVSATIEK